MKVRNLYLMVIANDIAKLLGKVRVRCEFLEGLEAREDHAPGLLELLDTFLPLKFLLPHHITATLHFRATLPNELKNPRKARETMLFHKKVLKRMNIPIGSQYFRMRISI